MTKGSEMLKIAKKPRVTTLTQGIEGADGSQSED
jgi:hypothetical protein